MEDEARLAKMEEEEEVKSCRWSELAFRLNYPVTPLRASFVLIRAARRVAD